MAFEDMIVRGFSALTLLGTIILIFYVLDFILLRTGNKMLLREFWRYFKSNALLFVFIISVLATGGSLIFSEILGFSPCQLCWFQRIFMYPQVLITGLALIRKQKNILPYLLMLSIIGALIAGFHYYGQISDETVLPCSAIGFSASCAENFFTHFGYVTIPMMSLIAFLLIIGLWYLDRSDF